MNRDSGRTSHHRSEHLDVSPSKS